MKKIPLTRGQFALVDDCDYERVMEYKWVFQPHQNPRYTPYARRRRNAENPHASMHRFILNALEGMEVDHIDGNGLNNQRANMRLCTHAQNNRNSQFNNKHGMKGVAFIPNRRAFKKWISKITADGKMKTIGYYWTMKEAAVAYNEAAIKLHGDFARLNQIPE